MNKLARIVDILLIILFAVWLCGWSGCDAPKRDGTQPVVEKPVVAADAPAARIAALEKKLADAAARGDEIARLSALKDLIAEKLRQAESEVVRLGTERAEADKALGEARTAASQAKLWWFVGIMGVASLTLVAVAIFVPSVAKWSIRGAVACGATAALAAFVSWLLPYLFWIGLALIVIGVIACIVYWRLDAKSRDQVVKAVDDLKGQIPGYKAHFRQFVDEDSDGHLDRVRERLGLKPKGV